jgi:hypothetical protein
VLDPARISYFTVLSSSILPHLVHRTENLVNISQWMSLFVLRRGKWHSTHIFENRLLLKYHTGYDVELVEYIADIRHKVGFLGDIEQLVISIVLVALPIVSWQT